MKNEINGWMKYPMNCLILRTRLRGDETGCVAGELHESVNRIWKAQRMIKNGATPSDNRIQMLEWMKRQPIFQPT